jgi:predicted RNA-binding protein with EMAP domain
MSIEQTLAGRESTYGKFSNHAEISQKLKEVMYTYAKPDALSDCQKEALEMIMHKVARILNGNPNYVDNWHDIAGYATLVEMEFTNAHKN